MYLSSLTGKGWKMSSSLNNSEKRINTLCTDWAQFEKAVAQYLEVIIVHPINMR